MRQFFYKINFALWYIFKSPQRKFAWITLWQDTVGLISYLFLYCYPIRPKPISICVGIYNRSHGFITHFLQSLNNIQYQNYVELSVFDCGSNDVNNLENEIKKIWKGKLVYQNKDVAFSRSYSFNKAVSQSSNNIIFLCDADFSLPNNIVLSCNKYTLGKLIWFPIVFYLYKNKPAIYDKKNGEWMQWGGKGLLACNKKHYMQVGGLDEKFTKWGQEDDDLWERFYKNKYYIIRSYQPQLMHHWHPSLNKKYQDMEANI